MNYFIVAILLYNFNAGTGWWVGFVTIAFIELGLLGYKTYLERTIPPVEEPNIKDLIKMDGTPYTYQDLQNIWNNGYQNGYVNSQMTKQ